MTSFVPSSHQPPSVGFGLWKVPQDKTSEMVFQAIQKGYRHIDSASDYGNEIGTGNGIAKALAEGVVNREALWVTSKLWNTYHRPEHVRPAVERSLRELQADYLDLYLIHFPISLRFVPFETRYPPGWFFDPNVAAPKMEPDSVPIMETYQAMERLVDAGLVKQIGISNFGTSLIRDVLSYARIRPSVLQVEMHPYLTQHKLLKYCKQEGIHVTAFSPLGAPSYIPIGMASASDSVLEHPTVQSIAKNLQRSPAQVVLAWNIQRGVSVVCKTNQESRLIENLRASEIQLSDEDMNQISGLDRNQRFNDPGVFCELAFNTFFPIYE